MVRDVVEAVKLPSEKIVEDDCGEAGDQHQGPGDGHEGIWVPVELYGASGLVTLIPEGIESPRPSVMNTS